MAIRTPEVAGATAVILAGGLGTRLQTVLMHRPKVLAEVRGRPFLAHLLERLHVAGISQTVLCTGYLGDQVEQAFGASYQSMRLVYSRETTPLGTAGALRLALPLLQSNPVFVMNGDCFCDVDLKALWTWHQTRRALVTICLTYVRHASRYGRVHFNHEHREMVASFEEKQGYKGPSWVNAGIYLMDRALLRQIPTQRAVSLEREMFCQWTGQGIYGYRSRGRFLDIGTPATYAKAAQFLTATVGRS